jgi:hypothetical protein
VVPDPWGTRRGLSISTGVHFDQRLLAEKHLILGTTSNEKQSERNQNFAKLRTSIFGADEELTRPSLVTAQCCIKPNPLIRANTQSPRTENPQLRFTVRGDPLIQDKLDRPVACRRGSRQNRPPARARAFLGEDRRATEVRGARRNCLPTGSSIRQKTCWRRARKSFRASSGLSSFRSARIKCFWKAARRGFRARFGKKATHQLLPVLQVSDFAVSQDLAQPDRLATRYNSWKPKVYRDRAA